MKALILGSSGPIGQAIGRALRGRGAFVVGASRVEREPQAAEDAHVAFPRQEAARLTALIAQERFDVVVDVIGYTEADTLPVLKALQGFAGRYVFVSSCDVYRAYGVLQGRETGPPETCTEEAALRSSRFPHRGATPRAASDPDAYLDHYDKIPLEDAVRGLEGPWTILRLPMVYGPGDRRRRFDWAIRPMAAGAEAVTAPAAWLDFVSTYAFMDTMGDAAALAALHPAGANSVFNIADEAPVSNRAWAERFAAALCWSGGIEATEDPGHPMASAIAGLDLRQGLKISAAALEQRLGWRPAVPLADRIAATLADSGNKP